MGVFSDHTFFHPDLRREGSPITVGIGISPIRRAVRRVRGLCFAAKEKPKVFRFFHAFGEKTTPPVGSFTLP
jgi:hypothetical protein